MLDRHAIAVAWSRLRAGREPAGRAPRRRRCGAWGVEALEGRALLSVYLVDSPGDAGMGSGFVGDLRYAIDQANQAPGDSTILFAPTLAGQEITLAEGMLTIDKPSGTLTIDGPGAGALSISGGKLGEVLDVAPGSKATITGLTITGGIWAQGPGGGIENDGQLTIGGCTITGNTAIGDGGGGIANGPSGTMTIHDSTISGNVAMVSDGGGISNAGTMTIMDSTVSGNASRGGNGGGITNTGILSIGESTISGNKVTVYHGGGIYNAGALRLSDDTIADNTANYDGGGLANEAILGGTTAMDNTIVADNASSIDVQAADILDDGDPDGSHLSGSYDLVGVGEAGGLGSLASTIVGSDPQLGPLQDNGGPTFTQAIPSSSPAAGAGDPALVPLGIISDQRGAPYSRVVQGQLDIGAFEIQTSPAAVPLHPLAPQPVHLTVAQTAEVLVGLTIVPPGPSQGTNTSPVGTVGTTSGG